MKATSLFIGRTYRLKPEVFSNSVQADGSPLVSADIAIVRVKYHNNPITGKLAKRAWYYDAKGNAYRSEDFQGPAFTSPDCRLLSSSDHVITAAHGVAPFPGGQTCKRLV